MQREVLKTKGLCHKKVGFAPLVLAGLLLCLGNGPLKAQEKGFVALSKGPASYSEDQAAIGTASYFMVRPYDANQFSLGAMIFSSSRTVNESGSTVRSTGATETSVTLTNAQHVAYGTLFGYTLSADGFLGLQVWGATGYMSNYLSLESSKIATIRPTSGAALFCQGNHSGTTSSVYTFPVLLGFGFTIWDFGVYVQRFQQSASPVEASADVTRSCVSIDAQETASTSSDTQAFNLPLNFAMTSLGIHYRF